MVKHKYNTAEKFADTYPAIRMKKVTFLKEDWRGRLKKGYEFEEVQFYDKEADVWIDAWLEPTEHEVRMET